MSSLSRGPDDRPTSPEVTEGVRDGAGAGQVDSADVFVARQPIFDPSQRVFGYELLFRSGFVNACDATHPTDATARVMDSTMSVFGFDRLTLGGHAFVNVTRDVLVNGSVLIMPSDRTVLELLETVAPDEAVV